MHTTRIGGVLGAGDDRRRLERRQRRRSGYLRGALRRSWMGDFGSKSSTFERKNIWESINWNIHIYSSHCFHMYIVVVNYIMD
jgi:hypothetical protein